jgi:cytoskeletal protein CcmA (bactofilin family)
MFSKTSKPAPQPAARPLMAPQPVEAAPVRKAAAVSVIGKDITVEGGVSGEGELQVDGLVRGDVRVGRVSVGESGQIEGSVIAEQVECRGRIIGSITAKQIRLFGTAHVDGDITHEQLAMETGAFFQGRSMKFQRPVQQGLPQQGYSGAAPQHAPQSQPQQGHAPMGDVINLGSHN